MKRSVKHFLGVSYFRTVGWAVLRFKLDRSPVMLPWFAWHALTEPIDRVHKLAMELDQANMRGGAFLWCRTILWLIIVPLMALARLGKHGGWVRRERGIGLFRQFVTMLTLGYKYNVLPEYYYQFRPFIKQDLASARYYVQHHEQMVLLKRLNEGTDLELAGDKLRFFRFCEANGLSTAPITAFFENGRLVEWMGHDGQKIPPRDAFLKPTDGCHGAGAECWHYHRDQKLWERDGVRLDEDGLLAHCSRLSEKRPIILQPRLVNSDTFARFTSGALATLRIITYRFQNEAPRFLTARLGIPTGGMIVDHDDSSLGAGVAFDDGVMTCAVSKTITAGTWQSHPDTGCQIEGVKLEGFHDVVRLCLRAHALTPQYTFVGWDSTMTLDGPVLMEANLMWGQSSSQDFQQTPLGRTPYAECLLASLQGAEAEAAGPQQ